VTIYPAAVHIACREVIMQPKVMTFLWRCEFFHCQSDRLSHIYQRATAAAADDDDDDNDDYRGKLIHTAHNVAEFEELSAYVGRKKT